MDVTIAEGYDNDWRGEGKSAAPGPLLSAVRVKRETVIFYLLPFTFRRSWFVVTEREVANLALMGLAEYVASPGSVSISSDDQERGQIVAHLRKKVEYEAFLGHTLDQL